MEERIIDDEFGRGVRLKKTKDGYVDVTDELAENGETEEVSDEISFEFPTLREMDEEGDDEELVDLSPEEAERVRREKAEANARRKAEYERLCAMGASLLETGSFNAAELEYERALKLDKIATEASVGYWKAKTANFTNPDVLASEYVESGIENLEYDLGYEAADIIKREYHENFKKRLEELEAEEKPLLETVEEKQAIRREVLSARKVRSAWIFLATALPFLGVLIATIIIGLKNFSTTGNEYIMPTIVLACVSVVVFIIFIIVANRFINACRMYRLNERLSSTAEGEKILEIREYKELYEALLFVNETEDEEEN